MRLLIKLLFSILSVLLLAGTLYLMLPVLLTGLLRAELENQGFDVFEVDISSIDFRGATLERLRASSDAYIISLKRLRAHYSMSGLLSAMADTVEIEQFDVSLLSSGNSDRMLPEPGVLAGLLGFAWHEFLPARELRVSRFSLYDEKSSLILSADGEIFRKEKQLNGEFSLVDTRGNDYRVSLSSAPTTGIHLELVSRRDDSVHPLSVKLMPLEGGEGLKGLLRADLFALGQLLGPSPGVSGELEASLNYFKSPDSDTQLIELESKLREFEFGDIEFARLTAQISAAVVEDQEDFQLSLSDLSSVKMTGLHSPQFSLREWVLEMPDSVLVSKLGKVNFTRNSNASVMLEDFELDGAAVTELRLDTMALDYTHGSACSFAMQLTTSDALLNTVRLSHTPGAVRGSCVLDEGLRWELGVSMQEMVYEDAQVHLSLGDCQASLGNLEGGKSLDDDPMELGGAVGCQVGAPDGKLNAQYRLHASNGVGRAHFTITDISPSDTAPLIDSVVKEWHQPFEIVSGKLEVEGIYRWWENSMGQDRERLLLDLRLRDAGGFYDNILFSGLAYTGAIEVLPSLQSTDFANITVEFIDIGMPINDSSLNLRLDASSQGELPVLVINDLRLPVFKGEIQGSDIHVDLNTDEFDIPLSVDGMDLAHIVDSQQIEGLLATGILDGQIPLKITLQGASVSGGKFIAREPGGRIQYRTPDSEVIGESAPASQLVLNILEDLQYTFLEVTLDYRENGDMEMLLAIRGMSPHVDSQRPVHFNLNLQQNLLKLLKQLRYTVGISDKIDRSVLEYFNSQGRAD